jgi:hypothetical protein
VGGLVLVSTHVLMLAGHAGSARAQEQRESAAEPLIPPRALRLSAVVIAPSARPLATPSDQAATLEVSVRVDENGVATLDEPIADVALRSAIERALAASELAPAIRGGHAVSARVRIALPVQLTNPPVEKASEAGTPTQSPAENAANASPKTPESAEEATEATYGAKGRVAQLETTQLHLTPDETRDLPGAFGDPFRVVDALPGVVPAISGLPYVYVRGAPPAGTNYYYDSIQVPVLFHLALGPAVVHPAMIGAVDFYPAVAPTRYGRYTGGVLAGGYSDRARPHAFGGEVELRLIDVNGMVEVPVGQGSLRLAGRYGYPGLILSVFSPDTILAYWDYQARLDLPLNDHDTFQLTWFGSFDRAGNETEDEGESSITLEFHRLEARILREVGRFELGSALLLGYDRSLIDDGLQAVSARIGPRVFALYRGQGGVRVRAGADFMGIAGGIDVPVDQEEATLGITTPLYADVAGRSISGIYAELHAPLAERFDLDAGVRSDVWLTGSRAEVAADPRATLTYRASAGVALHVAAGLAHQPAVFLIPLPGIADVGLDYGLQDAVQTEAGISLDLPSALSLESQLYVQRFTDMILPDLAIDQSDECSTLPAEVASMATRCNAGFPRASAWAYGLEAMLRRDSHEALSGWLSYTLGYASAQAEAGFDFTPSFDVRHVGNLVLQYRLGGGFMAGTRLHYRSGKVASTTFLRDVPIRYEQRLPGFFRADAQVSYAWATHWGQLRLALEWFNATLSREPTDIECHDGVDVGANPLMATPCTVMYAPALFFPNLGLRAEF